MTRHNSVSLLTLCVLLLVNSIAKAEPSFYEILGVARNASTKDIKKAFRALSKKYHPDVYKGDEKKYTDITEAYEALSKEETRRKYDRFGKEGLKETPQHHHQGDIFDMFGGGGRHHQQEEAKGAELSIDLFVSLEDIYSGRDVEIVLTKKTICSHCRGSGADNPDDVQVCDKCKGRGIYMEVRQMGPGFIQQTQTTCPKCKGAGRTFRSKCHVCSGDKILDDLETYRFTIEKGSTEGQKVTLYNSAGDYVDKNSSDLVFTLRMKPHPFFARLNAHDLQATVTISLKEALLGFKKKIRHLDGHFISIENAGVTQPNDRKEYKGEGLPKKDYPVERGSLFVKYVVELPSELSRRDTDLWESFFNN